MLRSAKIAPCFPYDVLERFWKDADDLGYHGVWDYDHFYGLMNNADDTFEGWTVLAAMAAHTSRARVGCMVTGVTYRHPAILAKMAVAVDHISGGRLEFGLGAAWHVGEHEGYGIEFPPPGTRIAMLDEALTVIKRMWTEDAVDHDGRFWKLQSALCNPKPVQGRIPVVVGGSGERKTLRVVAKHADEWNFPAAMGAGPDDFERLSGVLNEHCAAVGRDASEIRRSVQLFIYPENPQMAKLQLDSLDEYEKRGADHVVLSFYSPPSRQLLEELAPR
jgi:F420-dependent oxidoreductase-like protein